MRYGPLYKPSLFGALYEQVYELSLRKAWQAAISMKPHIVIFLGDMLASGRKVKHSEEYVIFFDFRRVPNTVHITVLLRIPRISRGYFRSIVRYQCTLFPETRTLGPSSFSPASKTCTQDFDSLNLKASDSQRAWANYVEHFGQPNNKLSVSNHTLVLLDAPGLVEEDYQRAEEHVEYPFWTPVKGGAVEFVNALQKQDDGSSSHITELNNSKADLCAS